jgi:hypothetical protein
MPIKNKNIKLALNYGLGPVLFVWLCWSLWRQINQQPNIGLALKQLQSSLYGQHAYRLYIPLILVAVNWSLEAAKWKLLLKPLEKISFTKAIKAILSGVAFSMNTPNRIGEYGGRVVYVQDGHRWQAVSLTIIGSCSQLIVTLLMGVGGVLFLLNNKWLAATVHPLTIWLWVLFYGTASLLVVLLILFFRLGWMFNALSKIPAANRLTQHLSILQQLRLKTLLQVLLLSAVRYLVFVIQYMLLLQLFNVGITAEYAFWLTTVLYLVLATIPSIALLEIGVRGKISVLLFGMISSNTVGIIGSAAAIWLMNLMLPALIGSILFLGLKILSDK